MKSLQALKIFWDLLLQKEYLGVYLKAWNKHNDKSPYSSVFSAFVLGMIFLMVFFVCFLLAILFFGPISIDIEATCDTTQTMMFYVIILLSFIAVTEFRPAKRFCIAVAWFENARHYARDTSYWTTDWRIGFYLADSQGSFPDSLLEALQGCLAQMYTAPILALEKDIAQVSVFPMKVYWIRRKREAIKKEFNCVVGIISNLWPQITEDSSMRKMWVQEKSDHAEVAHPNASAPTNS